jgi:hypothetical protein
VLKLQEGKYYIGKTSNPQFRLESHFSNSGSEWTRIYKPIKVLEIIPNCDDYDEDKYTKIYMDKYGIDNVRGGSYTSIKLDTLTKKQLIRISNSTNNRCFKCGKEGHFAKNCSDYSEEDIANECSDYSEEDIVWCCEYCDKEFEDENKCIYHEKNCRRKNTYKNSYSSTNCFRCGRDGHYATSCYASKHIKGYYLC